MCECGVLEELTQERTSAATRTSDIVRASLKIFTSAVQEAALTPVEAEFCAILYWRWRSVFAAFEICKVVGRTHSSQDYSFL